MTYRQLMLAAGFLGMVLQPLAAYAEIQDTTASLGPGNLSLAGEFQVDVRENTPLLVNLHQAIGLANGWDLVLREGLPLSGQGFYFGGGIKWTLLAGSSKKSRPGIALWLGGHGRTNSSGGADATIIIDYNFGQVTPYLGLDANLELFKEEVEFLLGFIGGARIRIAQNISWFVEGGLGILGHPKPHFIATGPRITF